LRPLLFAYADPKNLTGAHFATLVSLPGKRKITARACKTKIEVKPGLDNA
jgi:hypothetical protein